VTAGAGYEVDPESRRATLDGLADFGKRAADTLAVNSRVLGIGLAAAEGAAPKRTGELIGSMAIDPGSEGGTLTVGVRYAPYHEFGTRYVQARRFMKAGHDAMTEAAEPAYSDHLDTAIRSVGG